MGNKSKERRGMEWIGVVRGKDRGRIEGKTGKREQEQRNGKELVSCEGAAVRDGGRGEEERAGIQG